MRRSRRGTWLAVASAALMAFVGCDGGEPVDELAGRKREILASLGTNVVLPILRDFATAADALEDATAAYAADPTPENRMVAEAAWIGAIAVWQRAELMQIGPAGMGGTTTGVAGGRDLRDEIYSWPTTSTCRVDQETVEDVHADPDAFASELVNVRGLDAMEYLLFVETTDNTCLDTSPINTEGTWAALSPDAITQRRATYAHTLAVLVARTAAELRDAWEPTGGAFVDELATAGEGSALFASAQQALNDLAGALLYLDNMTRDMKLAEPAGISMECTADTCPDAVESLFAQRSKEHIVENLRGFELLFLGGPLGGDGLGMDDLLVDVGAGALATQVTDALEDAIAAVDAIPGTLREAIVAGDPAVMAAYDAIGVVQRLFKVDVVATLDLTPNSMGAGDND